jgi:hypothetical protein
MSFVTTTEGPVILIVYPWRLQVAAEAPVFAQEARYLGQVRAKISAPEVLATLLSEAGGVIWISERVLELALTGAETALMAPGRVVLDLVRIDLPAHLHLGFSLEIPVQQPVTRGGP